jgi:hypothetical protein
MLRWTLIVGIAATALLADPWSVSAGPACATMPTMAACVRCGEAKYGHDVQAAYCRENWKPGRKPMEYDEWRKRHPSG